MKRGSSTNVLNFKRLNIRVFVRENSETTPFVVVISRGILKFMETFSERDAPFENKYR